MRSITKLDDKKTFITTKKDNHSKVEVEIGDIKRPNEFHPQAKLKYWDNECNFSIRYNDPDNDSMDDTLYGLDDQVVRWRSKDDKREVRLYELDGFEDGGFEIEVILNDIPESNVIEYTLQTKGLDFFYQPPLTEKQLEIHPETKEPIYGRPDNVIGSYAAYHKSKSNNEYRTGKAFHIYRPEAIDSKGNKVWCDLNIDEENDLLNITIDQNWLENASYPVVVDPTFGNDTSGSSYVTLGSNAAACFKAESPSAGTVYDIYAYSSGQYGFKAVIWDGDDGAVNKAGSSIQTNTTPQWFSAGFFGGDPTMDAETDYYWGYVNLSGLRQYYDSGNTYTSYYDSSNNMGTPTAMDGTSVSDKYSIYIDYTAAALPEPIIDLDPTTLTPSAPEGSDADDDTFRIYNDGIDEALVWTGSDNVAWLTMDSTSGSVNSGGVDYDEITVSYDSDALSVGDHTGTITITDSNAQNSPQTIAVTLTITEYVYNLKYRKGGTTYGIDLYDTDGPGWNETLAMRVDGDTLYAQLDYNTGHANASDMRVRVNGMTLAALTESGTPSEPAIDLTPTTLSPTCDVGVDATNENSFTIENSGYGTLNWTSSDDAAWLTMDSTAGTTTSEADTITITYDTDALAEDVYTATITVTDSDASNDPQTIAVDLTVGNPVVGEWFGTGQEPYNTDGSTSANYTYCGDWVSTKAGSITKIEVYMVGAADVDFAVFTKSSSTFTDTDWTGNISCSAGLNQFEAPGDFTAMDIAVGQYIGQYTSGQVERNSSGGTGYWYDSGDQIGDGSGSSFSESSTSRDIQLRVWIE